MFSMIYHPDPAKRAAFLSGYKDAPSPRQNSQKKYTTFQNTLIAWESAPHIPVHTYKGADNVQVWIIGHIEDIDMGVNPAEFIFNRYSKSGYTGCTGHSGFFHYILQDRDTLIAGTDQLGLFPAYYYQFGESLVIGSSPSTPHFLPDISLKPNLYGIVGILLTMHELDNKSIWGNVSRIPAGRTLRWKNGKIELLSGFLLPVTDKYFSLPFEAHVEIADEAMASAINRYSEVDILLSGGLDSRLLAGYLKREGIQTRKSYTLGKKTDIEWKCAHSVAKFLGNSHQLVSIDFNNFERYILTQIFQEQLANGVTDLGWWSLIDLPNNNHPLPFINGLLGDAILGGSHIPWGLNLKDRKYHADTLCNSVKKWGINEYEIEKIFPQEMTSIIKDINSTIKDNFDKLPGYDFQKSWQYDLLNRQRYHIGGVLSRLAYRFWPAVPYTSNAILKCAGGVPASSLMLRQIQKALLKEKFRNLAALPIDNNTLYPTALVPTIPRKIFEKLLGYLPKRSRDIRTTCYYHRMFDIGNPGWKSIIEKTIKKQNNKSKTKLSDFSVIFSILNNLLESEYSTDIADRAGYKNLLALVLWIENTK